MGLLSAFGVGGGKITVQLQTPSIQAGGAIQGVVTFAGGKRAQQITAIKLRLTRTHAGDPSGQGAPSQSQDIVPEHPISGPLAIQPQQMQQLPFQLAVPANAPSSIPGKLTYAVRASADIDGEIDPGGSADVVVVGNPAFAGQGMPQAYDPNFGMMKGQGYDPKMGMYEQQKMAGYDPKMAGYDPNAVAYKKEMAGYDPKSVAYQQPMGGYDPKGAVYDAKSAMLSPGMHCQAVWNNGQYYGGTLLETNGSQWLVQWDDGSQPSWVPADQVYAG